MNKMLVTTFKTEVDAYKGLDVLKDLNEKGDITLYATAVLTKDFSGKVEIKQSVEEGPVGTAVGMLTGAMVGLLGGPVGVAVGTTAGTFSGLLFDIGNIGLNADFLDEVSEILAPGKSVVLAEVDEDWITPVDTKMGVLGGHVFRRSRSEVFEDQLTRESEAFSQELNEIREELKNTSAETKSVALKTLKSIEKRLEEVATKADTKLTQIDKETEVKVNTLQTQMKTANEEQKARIEKRIAEIKANRKMRSEKLQEAKSLAIEALKP